MKGSLRIVIPIGLIVALAIAFWVVALSPKRQEASKLGSQVSQLKSEITQSQSEAAAALEARKSFPRDYSQLVALGKAVPASDDTPSLLVELDQIANHAGVQFRDIALDTASSGAGAAPATSAPPPAGSGSGSTGFETATPASATTPPTEAAASLLPLGATVGTAGLGVMPYKLTFRGSFFHVADFIKGLDSLVRTNSAGVVVNGRLVTIDGFALAADGDKGFPSLDASFAMTTYLTPPQQGLTAGASPSSPGSTLPPAVDTSSAVSTTP